MALAGEELRTASGVDRSSDLLSAREATALVLGENQFTVDDNVKHSALSPLEGKGEGISVAAL